MMTHRIARLRAAKKYRRSISYIPNIFTFSNAILGFLALGAIINNQLIYAAYCIIIAGFMDLFDGKIARALGATSNFGKELDSLSDAVSFCVAPSMLLYAWFSLTSLTSYCYILVLGFYLCAGLARLALFNSNAPQTKKIFKGLPTTAAALCIAFFTLEIVHAALNPWIMICIVLSLAYLMVSALPFVSLKKMPAGHHFRILCVILALASLFFLVHLGCFCIFLYIIVNLFIAAGKHAKRSQAVIA